MASLGSQTTDQSSAGVSNHPSHDVEFYEDDAILLDGLSNFLHSALQAGGVCLVIATAPHRQGIAQRLRMAGVDLALAVRNEQYLLLDAEATLAKFMVEGSPDRDRFFAAIEPLLLDAIANLGPGVPHPVAFGEMVALLCAEGKPDAAILLEQYWNELARRHSFILRCAYPQQDFQHGANSDLFRRICREHTHVLPSQSA